MSPRAGPDTQLPLAVLEAGWTWSVSMIFTFHPLTRLGGRLFEGMMRRDQDGFTSRYGPPPATVQHHT